MANRFCERPPCGAKMSPLWPRKRMPNGELWCPACAINHGRNLTAEGSHEGSVPVTTTSLQRLAVRVRQGALAENASSEQRLAHFVAWDQPDIMVLAHDSGDSQTIFHCCFCGSGQVIARSDGTVECEFCHSAFTVQVQPQFSAFPQTIDGVPVDVPGMPSNSAPMPGEDPAAPVDEEGDFPPGDEAEEGDEEDDGGGDKPAFLKGSMFRTATGAQLSLDPYLRHLALSVTSDREALLERMRGDAAS